MTEPNEPRQISVSRDALRADLAELREGISRDLSTLKDWMRDELAKKAAQAEMERVARELLLLREQVSKDLEQMDKDQEERQAKFDRGEFNDAQTRSFKEIIVKEFDGRAKQGFSAGQRRVARWGLTIAFIAMLTGVGALIITAVHYF